MLALVRQFDEHLYKLAFTGERHTGIANSFRGGMTEWLVMPAGSRPQVRLVHPGGTNKDPTIIDYENLGPPITTSGKREFVEVKSDLLPAGEARSTARKYVRDAVKDRPAVDLAGGVHMIQFLDVPPTDEARAAMLEELFKPDSPFVAVRFGDGKGWIMRPATP
jgi:hypothetical protein